MKINEGPVMDDEGYDRDDPKNPNWVDDLFERVGR